MLSLTFVPAMIAIVVTGRVQRAGERLRSRPEGALPAGAGRRSSAGRCRRSRRGRSVIAGAALLFARLGQEFIPTLDEKNIVMQAMRIPSTSLAQSQAMQLDQRER